MNISQIINMGIVFYAPIINMRASESRKDELRKEWRETMNLPRKTKKKRRKELRHIWNFETTTFSF